MVDLRGRLDPESIPGTKVDTDTIADQAATLGSMGTAIGGAGGDAALEWQSMATHYVAPEGDLLLGLMGPVETMTSSVSADTATAQTALATFADEAAPIVKKLVDLKVAAWNFLTKTEFGITIPGDSPYNIYEKAKPKGKFSPPPSADDKPESVHLDWDQYQPWVDENEERQTDVTTQATLLAEKVATCVNILLPMVETVLGEEIPEYVPMDYVEFEASGGALPWGVDVPDAHTDGIHFTAGILESLAETISGLGTLVLGFNPETGGFFDGSVWGPSWVSTLALAGALVVQPLDDLLDGFQQGNVDDDWLDGADNGLSTVVGDEAWKTTWEGFVGTPEDWEKNPAHAAGSLTFNIGTVLIPTGAGAAAKATALGEKVSSVAAKAAAAAADAGVPTSLSVKLGQLLADGLLTVGGGLTKLDDALNAALKPFADALAKADTSVADFAAWVKSLPEFQGPDGQFAGIPNGFKPDAPSGGKPDPWTTTVTAPDRVPGSPGGLVDEHGGMRDPGGRGPDLDGDGKLDVRDPDGTGRPPLQDGGAAEMPGGSAGPGGFPESPKEFPRPEPLQTIEVPKGEGPGKNTPFAKRDDLEPNTLYHVEGRGDFYTDASGKVTYVEATYGGKGNLNADLNKPQGNITYVVHPNAGEVPDGVSAAHVFVTDDLGRTVLAHTDHLSLGEADRSPSVQGRVGGEGGDGYDGGHLFGKGYGGGGEYTNMAAMLEAINRGGGKSYFTLENEWRDLLKADPSTNIEVRITPEYSGDSKVPDKFFVDYRINDGDWEQKEYENER